MAFQPPSVTKLELDDDIKNAVNGALEAGHPIVMGYVGDNGYPPCRSGKRYCSWLPPVAACLQFHHCRRDACLG